MAGLLSWYNLIFLLPLGAASLLLVLGAVRGGGRHHHASAHGGHHTSGHGIRHAAPQVRHHAPGVKSGAHRTTAKHAPADTHTQDSSLSLLAFLSAFLGWKRAPFLIVAGAFCLCWGAAGLLTNQAQLPTAPTLTQLFPSLGIAFAGGFMGARLAAEGFARLLPPESTSAVSRDGLYGLVGRVVFPVSETAGRVRIYDDGGTLHDEPCRIAPGITSIAKGREVMILDRDSSGNLLVEEMA